MIAIESLIKRHGTREVLHGVSLEAHPGHAIGSVGPSDTGKSSILRCLLGLDRADGRQTLTDGCTYHELREPLRTVGAILDGLDAHPSRMAHGHLGWVVSDAGISRHRVTEVLDVVGLSETAGRRMRTFSLGMGQRLGLAAALLGGPEVLVLDEPVSDLDPEGIRWIRRLFRQRVNARGTVLLSSHVLARLTEVADDVVVITDRRVRTAETLEEVAAGYANLEETFFSLTAPAGGVTSNGAGQTGRTRRTGWADRAEREDGGRP